MKVEECWVGGALLGQQYRKTGFGAEGPHSAQLGEGQSGLGTCNIAVSQPGHVILDVGET